MGCFEDFMEFREEVEKAKKERRENRAQSGNESAIIDSDPVGR